MSLIFAAQELGESAKTAALAVRHSPIGKGGHNWITRTGPHNSGELPAYIQNIRNAIMRDGKSESEATAIATAAVERWVHGHGHVKPEVKAAAAKTEADYEKVKAKSKLAKVREQARGGCTVPVVSDQAMPVFEADATAGAQATMMESLRRMGHAKSVPGKRKGQPEVTVGTSPDSGGIGGWMFGTIPDTFATSVALGGLGEALHPRLREALGQGDVLSEKTLSMAERRKLPKSKFAIPEKAPGPGSYPIGDRGHAVDALARSKGKPEEGRVRSAVLKAFPDLKDKVSEGLLGLAVPGSSIARYLHPDGSGTTYGSIKHVADGSATIEHVSGATHTVPVQHVMGSVPGVPKVSEAVARKVGRLRESVDWDEVVREATAPPSAAPLREAIVSHNDLKGKIQSMKGGHVKIGRYHVVKTNPSKHFAVHFDAGAGKKDVKLGVTPDVNDAALKMMRHAKGRGLFPGALQEGAVAPRLMQEPAIQKGDRVRVRSDLHHAGLSNLKGRDGTVQEARDIPMGGNGAAVRRLSVQFDNNDQVELPAAHVEKVGSPAKVQKVVEELELLLEGEGPRDYGSDAWSGALARAKSLNQGETMRFPDGTALKRHASPDGRDQWSSGTPSSWRDDGTSWGTAHRKPEDAVKSAMESSAASRDPESLGGEQSFYRGMSVMANGNGLRFSGVSPTTGNALVSHPDSPSFKPQEVDWSAIKPNSQSIYQRS